jgi:ABC-type nitrate/sulfonate/bicarbonate transport system substrate-binding protein
LIARECSIDANKIETYLEPDYRDKFLPQLDGDLVEAIEVVKSFLHEHQFIDRDFLLEDWIKPGPLTQAYQLEGLTASPSH